MMRAWTLIGMMGAGKTTIGRMLAELSGREFVDTDVLIQNRLGKTIPKIFEFYGEPTFREHESSIVQSLTPGPYVISTGGGAIMRQENWDHLSSIGELIYLQSSPEVLKERLRNSKRKRPLLLTENWVDTFDALFENRKTIYEKASVVINLDDIDVADAALKVYNTLIELERGRGGVPT
jgi:shikimate kinase